MFQRVHWNQLCTALARTVRTESRSPPPSSLPCIVQRGEMWSLMDRRCRYTRLTSQSILPKVSAEDPSLWIDHRGNYHFLMHYLGADSSAMVARHAFSRSYMGPWSVHIDSIPYNTTVQFNDGSSVAFHKRERPHLVFDSDGKPTYLVTGVVQPGSNERGYSGLSYTLIQGIRSE